jgi:hypothetical protein
MSRRFGRNQRRRAREQIAALTDECKRTYSAYNMAAGLNEYQGKRIGELEAELNEAKGMAHGLSVLFPAKTVSAPEAKRAIVAGAPFAVKGGPELVPLAVPQDLTEVDEALMYRQIPLPVLLMRIRQDILDGRVHVRVAFNDGSGETGYAINGRDFCQYPQDVMVRRVREIIAPQIASHLVAQFYRKG